VQWQFAVRRNWLMTLTKVKKRKKNGDCSWKSRTAHDETGKKNKQLTSSIAWTWMFV